MCVHFCIGLDVEIIHGKMLCLAYPNNNTLVFVFYETKKITRLETYKLKLDLTCCQIISSYLLLDILEN